MNQQPEKKFAIKIENLPRKAQENNIKNFLLKKVKTLKDTEYDLAIERNDRGKFSGLCWFASKDKKALAAVLRLHNQVSLLFIIYIDVCWL